MPCCRVRLSVSEDAYALKACERVQRIGVTESAELKIVDYPTYDGPTEITPTRSTQVFPTSGQVVLTDLIVNPIPRNYGLITDHGGGRISVS